MPNLNSFPPVYNEPMQKASENLRQTLPLINKHKTPANPVNYAVWYEYVSGNNQRLEKEINLHLSQNNSISLELMQSLYEKNVLSDMPNRLKKANQDIRLVADNTLKNIGKVESTTTECVTDLNNAQNALDNCFDIGLLKNIIQDIFTKFQALTKTSQELKLELEQSFVEMVQLKSELETIKKIARTDQLTGLLNRGTFDIELRELCSQPLANAALLLFELDHFKNVNNAFGHITGDKVLQFLASLLQKYSDSIHLAARYGGTEMAMVLFNTSQKQALEIADSIRTGVADSHLKQKDNDEPLGKITVSAGISFFQMGDTPSSLINRATSALYKSKNKGRNQVHIT